MCSDFHRAESGTELLARLEGRSSLKEIEPYLFTDEVSSVHGDILEFHGPEGTGKTEMLYHLTARCILPKSEGGLEVEVLFIDTDYHFDMLRLVTILEHRLSQSSEEMVKHCLGRLFLVNCNSSTQLLLTLYSLETVVCSHPSLCLLILDSLSAFYWIDRVNGGESVNLQEATLKKCAQFLEKLVNEYRLVLFATTQSIMQKTSNWTEGPSSAFNHPKEADADYRPYLCKEWQQVVKHRIFFSKQEDFKTNQFSLVSRHLKSNSLKKHTFVIGENGIEFC
ncbi:DNA repair protein XRCC2 [Lycaon pictus]|uniref:X-ray repair cross complementing 2 n=2 Tax=Canis lupus familiaris TaxID=9615 RepID=A0A8C0PCM4_CANLF|nr:DNA repair protein XRCC2 [Canis lupus dingo]XP_038415712.1 DNA repair protein XRCC2 [Canis lupus familiaris]XP_038545479.1 DNA repair protein XRCC2 [Canis lupus familiaris]XP_532771.3 DNA repair protein XRCC2 [Canis lupus familiaris]|eukprot:XP_532771.3 DNA repair protein XRCC2 [Canis lupus familiaris]